MQACVPADRHWSLGLLYIARVVDGYGVGAASFILPLFAAEVAPAHIRGLLSGLMQFAVVFGVMLAGIMNLVFENVAAGWRYSTAVALLPCITVLVGSCCVPESPRWLYTHKGETDAYEALLRLREVNANEDSEARSATSAVTSAAMVRVQQELAEIKQAAAEQQQQERELEREQQRSSRRCRWGVWALVFGPVYRPRLMVACVLMLFQQCTGINPVITYGGIIIKDIGLAPVLGLAIVQGVNFLSTVLLFALNGLDNLGRRTLLLEF